MTHTLKQTITFMQDRIDVDGFNPPTIHLYQDRINHLIANKQVIAKGSKYYTNVEGKPVIEVLLCTENKPEYGY